MANINHKIWRWGFCGVSAVALVSIICLNNADTVKWLGMVMMIATSVAGVWRFRDLMRRMNPMLLMLTLITAMGGISTAYALSGKFALQGFLYLMVALCTSVLLTLIPEKTTPGRFVATTLAAAAALIGLLSLDHVSTRLISAPALSFLNRFTTVFEGVSGVEEQVRLTSILNMPNVFAGCAGLGVLLSLGLAMSATEKAERRFDLVLLYINSIGFFLAFSMGATIAVAGAFLVFLLLERKQERWGLLVLVALTFGAVLLGLVPVSMTILGGWKGFQPIPMLCLGGGAVLLCVADHYLSEKLTHTLQCMGKKIALFGCILVISAVAFVSAAWLVTGGSALSQGDGLRRAIYPDAGAYTVTAVYSGKVSVTVESQNRQEAMMHTATVLYSGDLEGAAFTVPEDSLVVYFNFTAQSDAALDRVVAESDAGSVAVPLDYRLLPDFIANRLQGFFANQNAIQRPVFFTDGLKLFTQSPLLGLGIGAFETAAFGVQGFYYETKYVHNHYIQTLLETGVVGLVLFVGLLVLSGIAVVKAKKERHPLRPALGALLVYMAIHACTEVVFSVGFYLPLAFGVFALTGVCCGEAMVLPKNVRTAAVAAAGVLLLTFAVLLGCNLRAAQIGHNAKTMEDFRKAEQLDPFEWTDYAVSFVANAPAQGSKEVLEQAEAYVNRLDGVRSNNIHFYLARYCFAIGQMERGMEMALKQAEATISSSRWWNQIFVLLYEYDDGSETYRTGVQKLTDLMNQWNGENIGKIVLDDAVQSYVDHVLTR